MANNVQVQVTSDGYRNGSLKLTGTLDSGDVTITVATLLTFVTNDINALVGFRFGEATFAISDGLEVNLEWKSNSPQQMVCLSGRGEISLEEQGGALPDRTLGGYDGSITLRTANFAPGTKANFTIMLELVKRYGR